MDNLICIISPFIALGNNQYLDPLDFLFGIWKDVGNKSNIRYSCERDIPEDKLATCRFVGTPELEHKVKWSVFKEAYLMLPFYYEGFPGKNKKGKDIITWEWKEEEKTVNHTWMRANEGKTNYNEKIAFRLN